MSAEKKVNVQQVLKDVEQKFDKINDLPEKNEMQLELFDEIGQSATGNIEEDIFNHVFVVLDTETTGAEPGVDEPIQAAAIKVQNGQIIDKHEWWIKPETRLIHPSAMAVHGITPKILKTKRASFLKDIKQDIIDFIGPATIIAHNSPFDMSMLPFLQRENVIDSLRLARHMWAYGDKNEDGLELTSHKAQEIRYWLKLEVDTKNRGAHDALGDIIVTNKIFWVAVNKYMADGGENKVSSLIDFCKKPINYPRMPFHKNYKGMPWSELPESYIKFYLKDIDDSEQDQDVVQLMLSELLRRRTAVATDRLKKYVVNEGVETFSTNRNPLKMK